MCFNQRRCQQKLFGSLNYVQCDPCQSIFGPAAYFVDLMRIIDDKITGKNNIPENLKLDQRRPDLKEIPLTCDNTKDTVPYTQIVNEVIARTIRGVFEDLSKKKYPRKLPYNFYLEQIRTYLGELNTNLADIYQTFHPQTPYSKTWAQAYLKLSPEEYKLITQPLTEPETELKERYGINEDSDIIETLTKRDNFLKHTGLSISDLETLLYQNLSSDEITSGTANQFYINKKLSGKKYLYLNNRGEIKIIKPDSYEETLNNDSLDRVDRFLHLAQKLDWSFTDLDWVLTSIGVNDLDENAIINVAKIKQLQTKTKLPLDVLCSLWYDMKTIGQGDNNNRPQDIFNRTFKNNYTLQGQEKWNNTDGAENGTQWTFHIENSQAETDKQTSTLIRKRLLGALQISDRELTEIINTIWGDITQINLNLSNLSKLFRIAQILKIVRLNVDEYKILLKFLGKKFKDLDQFKIDEVIEIIELAEWIKEAGFTVYELNYILNRQEYRDFIGQFDTVPFNAIDTYFCISENQEFAKYWDRVEDRLFKIRHCQNIQGIERQLALFSPPIDPRQLVRQAAAGASTVNLFASDTIPHYRFSYLLERAKGMVSTVIQLGSTLLSTLEKKDAEELALLRATQEPVLLQLITKTKEKQIEEAKANKDSLEKSKSSASDRKKHYDKLIKAGWNAREKDTVKHMTTALDLQKVTTGIRTASIVSYLLPSIYGTSNGGMKFGEAASMAASVIDSFVGIYSQEGSLASTIAQYQRRQEDWELQQQMAKLDVKQIQEQINAANIRIEIAEAELEVHNKSIEHSREVEEFLKGKYTNKELYQWMISRLSTLYFQTYKIALDMANAAQKAYQYELNTDETYITPTHWDSQKKGLLAGESLMLGLNQLEKAHLDQNKRRFEIEKIIPLRQLDPSTFLKLIADGSCTFDLEEKLFALDFPSHYCRQTKTISVSIPAVVGPYQNINATLTQTSNKVLIKQDTEAIKWLLTGEGNTGDGSIREGWRSNQQIAISKGHEDYALFVLNLNFRDERYLPFEGTGVNSSWKLDIPKASNFIDLTTITDVIITVSYTALDGGYTISKAVEKHFGNFKEKTMFSLKQELQQNNNNQQSNFTISPHLFRPNLQNYKFTKISVLPITNQGDCELSLAEQWTLKIADKDPLNLNNGTVTQENGLSFEENKILPQSCSLQNFNNSENLSDILLIIEYEGKIWTT